MERAKIDIGTYDSGMRGAIHRHAGLLLEHELRLEVLAGSRKNREVNGIDERGKP
jgi:hypothetical protein